MDQAAQDFLTTQNLEISVTGFVINLLLAAILSFLLRAIYIRYGTSLSNRRRFAQNFMLIILTTTLIITIVKSSLALSLGLVGALSIVRFRTAIKEPEELAYLFLAIAVGLGFGADQRAITLVAFLVIVGLIWIKHFALRAEDDQNLYLTIASHNPEKAELDQIVQVLRAHCTEVSLRRFDETKEALEAAFWVAFEDFAQLEATKTDLQRLGDSVTLSFLDNKGLGSIG